MITFFVAFRGLGRAILAVWRDPETKALPLIVGVLLLSGTIFYWIVEDWTFIEALYFSVVALTTVGFGDLTPTTDISRIFTIVYILLGLGVLVAFLSSVAQQFMRHTTDKRDRAVERLSAHTHHDQPPVEGSSQ